jgi:hypothetical protein
MEFLGPEDTGSMAAKLARMEAGAEPEPEPEVQSESEPAPEEKAGEEVAPAAPPPDETKPPETETPLAEEVPEGWEFKPKYKDHQEAEKGAREHQQKVTAATEETKREREARESAERERDEYKEKLAAREEAAKPPVKTAEELEDEKETRIEAALVEIGELDESDPAYTRKVAKAWRKAGIGGAEQPPIPDTKVLDEIIDRRVEEKIQAREAAGVKQREQEKDAHTWETAVELAAKSGLDMTADSADEILFRTMAKRLPQEISGKPLQEQVNWAVGEVRKRTGKVVQVSEAEKERARQAQANNAVLERGNTRPKTPEAVPRLRTMDEILAEREAREQRQRSA